MKANNLTICIDSNCRRNCPYCISKMTFYPKPNDQLFQRNLDKAVCMARACEVNNVLITSKGEPLQRLDLIKQTVEYFKDFPLEIQTNGDMLVGMGVLDMLHYSGVDTIAISVDSVGRIKELEPIFVMASSYGFNLRLTVILTDLWKEKNVNTILCYCLEQGIRQLTFRKATYPKISVAREESVKVMEWIDGNTKEEHYSLFDSLAKYMVEKNLIRVLPFGTAVYDALGIAVTVIPYCIQENHKSDDIRSLIYHQDGHMYTSWDKQSSILF